MTDHQPIQLNTAKLPDYRSVNLAAIERRWPEILNALNSTNTDDATVEYIHTENEPSLCVNGIHLSSCYDRNEEVQLQAGLVTESTSVIWVYGIGVGDLPNYLIKKKRLLHINIVVMCLNAFNASIQYFDQREWLSDPRVTLFLPEQAGNLQVPFCAVPACLKLSDSTAFRLRDEVVLELNTPFINKKYQENKSHVINLNDNIELIKSDYDAKQLFGKLSNHPEMNVYITAAGPTLSDNMDLIKERGSDTLLITVDAALRALRRAGVVPDVVVSIDSGKESIWGYLDLEYDLCSNKPATGSNNPHSDVAKYKNIPLVYFPVVNNEVLLRWPGPRYVAYSRNIIYEALLKQHPRALLYSAGSVLHPAVDLAVQMGGKTICLFGVDLSFPGGLSHISGVPGSRQINQVGMQREVLNGEGQMVPSWPNMIGYLRDLERYIANHNTIDFINMSRKGAAISGTRYRDEDVT